MPALEPLTGLRVVAEPAALASATWSGADLVVLRLAPDEAIGLAASGVAVADPDAIVVPEPGFVGAWCDLADLAAHVEWPWPTARPALAQGAVAGVPAKVWLAADDRRALLVVAAAYADELSGRLGWPR